MFIVDSIYSFFMEVYKESVQCANKFNIFSHYTFHKKKKKKKKKKTQNPRVYRTSSKMIYPKCTRKISAKGRFNIILNYQKFLLCSIANLFLSKLLLRNNFFFLQKQYMILIIFNPEFENICLFSKLINVMFVFSCQCPVTSWKYPSCMPKFDILVLHKKKIKTARIFTAISKFNTATR